MLKVLVLQKYHGLSDEETKYQIINRFGFLQFSIKEKHLTYS